MNYKVWDELNASEDTAQIICESDEAAAAIAYATDDSDGQTDGLYASQSGMPLTDLSEGHPILVRSPDGTLRRFKVGIIELEPVFDALLVP